MKRSLMIFILLASTLSALALNKTVAVEEEVIQAKKQLVQAMAQCDRKGLEQLMTAERINISTGGQVRERDEWLTSFATTCKPYKPATLEELRVKVYGDTAILVGRITFNGTSGGAPPPSRFSSVWIKRAGRWQEASMHVTPIQAKEK